MDFHAETAEYESPGQLFGLKGSPGGLLGLKDSPGLLVHSLQQNRKNSMQKLLNISHWENYSG